MVTRPAARARSFAMAVPAAVCLLSACEDDNRRIVDRWLHCEECDHRELDSLRSRGNEAVPLLAEALRGPSDQDTANVRQQLAEAYGELSRWRGPPTADSSKSENHYVHNYRSLYQSRAITGLIAIGTDSANAVLDSAAAKVTAYQFRPDVRRELNRAVAGRWATISAGLLRTCGTRIDGKSYCWGANDQGQLGDGSTTDRVRPTPIKNPSGATPWFRFISVALADSGHHTCGVSADKAAFCWGDNGRGQLGDGTTLDRNVPRAVVGARRFVGVTTGGEQTCGWTSEYQALCWGANQLGQLGDGTTNDRLVPTEVADSFGPVRISAGAFHTCADSLNNVVYCWGANTEGQLGDGSTTSRTTPVEAAAHAMVTSRVSAGATHTCLLVEFIPNSFGVPASCAGNNDNGQLGNGSTADRWVFWPVIGPRFLAISAGENHTCGISDSARTLHCWGGNQFGQLGIGNLAQQTTPMPVSGEWSFLEVSAGAGHTCGITTDGEAYCWGRNANGQLGDNTTTDRPTPVKVLRPL